MKIEEGKGRREYAIIKKMNKTCFFLDNFKIW